MTTSVGAPVTWITVTVRCKWCEKTRERVRGAQGTIISFRCDDRGCRMEQEFVIT